MKVSIIIPAYNTERYIKRCLNSTIKQTLDNSQYEIIVINDSSKDKTLGVIKKFLNKFNNFLIINNNKTQGPGISRNKGLRLSRGKYIFFLDSDDYIDQNAIKILYERAVKYGHWYFKVTFYQFKKILIPPTR